MGLLDSMDDPRTMGLLSLGMGLLGSKGSFGNALSQAGPQALQAMRQVQQDKARKEQMAQAQKMQALQMQQAQMQMQQAQMQIAEQQRAAAEAEAQRGRDEQFRSAIPAPVGAPIAQGPTPFGGFNIPGAVDPKQQLLYQALLQKQMTPMQYMQLTQKDTAPIKLGAGETLLEQGTFKPLFTNPKEDSTDPKIKQYEYAVSRGYKGTFDQFVTLGPTIMANAAAPLRQAQIGNIYAENDYNLPPSKPPASSPGGVVVQTPAGPIRFKDQAAANKFKFEARIK